MSVADGFTGRVALVTGAAGGIGAATARLLAERGAAVAVVDRDVDGAVGLADLITATGGRAVGFGLDVRDPDRVDVVFSQVEASLGPVSILVNNAGVAERSGFLDLALDEWRAVLDINLTGAFLCAQAAARRMIASGGGGAIVNVASVAGVTGISERTAYAASKHGLVGLTRVMALDLAAHGVRVNAVAPGSVETPLTAALLQRPGAGARIAASHPLGRWAQPEEVAELIAFLASDRASFMTGVVAPVDGGFLAGKAV